MAGGIHRHLEACTGKAAGTSRGKGGRQEAHTELGALLCGTAAPSAVGQAQATAWKEEEKGREANEKEYK